MMTLIAEAAFRSLVLGALVWLAMLVIRPRNPHLQKTVWLTVLLASIAMPLVLLLKVAPSIDAPEYLLSITPSAAPAASVSESRLGVSQTFLAAATAMYAIVAIALMARLGAGFFRLFRIRSRALPLALASLSELDVRVTNELLCPATFGSTILLPKEMRQWKAEKLAAVLSHEHAHVIHRDCYVLWLARLHACIFWFNPLAWWLSRRLADLAETTSDDAVITALPNRTGYADMLLEIARNPTREVVVTSAARGNISARIERIISNIPPAPPPRRWVRVVAIAVLIPPFTMAAATLQGPGRSKVAAPEIARAGIGDAVIAGAESAEVKRPGDAVRNATPPRTSAPVGQDDSADPMRPRVLGPDDWNNLEQYYPAEAKRLGKESLVVVEVDLDAQGNVVDARPVGMDPADERWQFAPAAIEVARKGRFSNPTGKPATFRMRVKFELKR